jgi:hypothetical protein
MTIRYIIGDATLPIHRPALIIHIVNDEGHWGAGFVVNLSKKYPKAENAYRHIPIDHLKLGSTLFVPVDRGVVVANMIAQHTIKVVDGKPPIRYEAIANCLKSIDQRLDQQFIRYTIHAPRFGTGLAGGKWDMIEPLINHYLQHQEVYIYDLNRDPNTQYTDINKLDRRTG